MLCLNAYNSGLLCCHGSSSYLCVGNVLLQANVFTPHGFIAKLADFGLAKQMEGPHSLSVQGTFTHLAPEVLNGGKNSTVSHSSTLLIVAYSSKAQVAISEHHWGYMHYSSPHKSPPHKKPIVSDWGSYVVEGKLLRKLIQWCAFLCVT